MPRPCCLRRCALTRVRRLLPRRSAPATPLVGVCAVGERWAGADALRAALAATPGDGARTHARFPVLSPPSRLCAHTCGSWPPLTRTQPCCCTAPPWLPLCAQRTPRRSGALRRWTRKSAAPHTTPCAPLPRRCRCPGRCVLPCLAHTLACACCVTPRCTRQRERARRCALSRLSHAPRGRESKLTRWHADNLLALPASLLPRPQADPSSTPPLAACSACGRVVLACRGAAHAVTCAALTKRRRVRLRIAREQRRYCACDSPHSAAAALRALLRSCREEAVLAARAAAAAARATAAAAAAEARRAATTKKAKPSRPLPPAAPLQQQQQPLLPAQMDSLLPPLPPMLSSSLFLSESALADFEAWGDPRFGAPPGLAQQAPPQHFFQPPPQQQQHALLPPMLPPSASSLPPLRVPPSTAPPPSQAQHAAQAAAAHAAQAAAWLGAPGVAPTAGPAKKKRTPRAQSTHAMRFAITLLCCTLHVTSDACQTARVCALPQRCRGRRRRRHPPRCSGKRPPSLAAAWEAAAAAAEGEWRRCSVRPWVAQLAPPRRHARSSSRRSSCRRAGCRPGCRRPARWRSGCRALRRAP